MQPINAYCAISRSENPTQVVGARSRCAPCRRKRRITQTLESTTVSGELWGPQKSSVAFLFDFESIHHVAGLDAASLQWRYLDKEYPLLMPNAEAITNFTRV